MSSTKPSVDIRGMAPLLLVYDMPVSLQFYCGILGFEMVSAAGPEPDFHWVLLSHQGTELMLEPIYPKDKRPAEPDAVRAAHHRDTVLYFGCANIDDAYNYLRNHDVKVEELRTASYGMKQLYLTDPDGYLLCFQWPASEEMFASWQERYGKDFRDAAGM